MFVLLGLVVWLTSEDREPEPPELEHLLTEEGLLQPEEEHT